MCSKIIFVLAMVYAFNASVLTDNISYDEDSDNSLSGLENSDLYQDNLDVELETSLNWCNIKACNWMCHRLNKTSGSCVNGRCNCEKSPIAEGDGVDVYSELDSKRVCRLSRCNRTCTRRGYEGATCIKGRCKCYNNTITTLPMSELSEDQTERSCNIQACDQLCRRLKFRGGACVNGRCKCDNFLGTDAEAVDEYLELDSRHVCYLKQCNRTCARRGYAIARCVNGWCKCYEKIEREDISSLDDVTNDEIEEIHQLLRNEEDLIEPAFAACN